MAYETGTATSRDELLDMLRVFLVANGWNQEGWAVDGTGYRLHVSKGGIYANFRTAARTEGYVNYNSADYRYRADQLAFNIGTGFNAASAWWNQPGVPPQFDYFYMTTGIAWGDGTADAWNVTYSYHFFENGKTVSVVVEGQPGSFKHLHFGKLSEYNLQADEVWFFTGWRLHTAETQHAFTSWGSPPRLSYVYLSTDTTWYYQSFASVSSGIGLRPPIPYSATTTTYNSGWLSSLLLPNPQDVGAVLLFPLIYSVGTYPRLYPVGQVADVRACLALHDEAEEYTLGDDTWILFSNGYRSIAIKKVVSGE
ncbi:MAG: hypothetical protein PHZ19_05945 [Candidatus Thermoplasmatota archaeon]|nr:hypothetical protein [Candidatus Thermoplasmatota archaeon]